MALVLSIDVGTTNIKAGLVNETGELLAFEKLPIDTHSSEPGAAEHNPEELKNLILNLCNRVIQSPAYKEQVSLISVSTYQFGLMLADEYHQPLTAMTLLTDTRAQQTFNDFLLQFGDLPLYEKTGCPLLSQYLLPRLYYFFKAKTELWSKIKYIIDSKSFLIEWMTGQKITDVSIATATQLFNLNNFSWDQQILERLSLHPNQFPVVADGHTTVLPICESFAKMLGLKKNVDVLLGVYDGGAMAVGLSGLESNTGCMNVGTTAMIRVPGNVPVFDTQDNKWIQPYAIFKNLFVNGGALNNAALAVDWLNKSVGKINANDPSLASINHDQPLFCLPYLTGERDSLLGPFASGVFWGLRRDHNRQDMARAVLEGVAYSSLLIYEALAKNNIYVHEMRMGGGGAQYKPWPHIFANVLNVPITLSEVSEIALIGNAILAFAAVRIHTDITSAFRHMVRNGTRIEPDPGLVPRYAEHYVFFKHLRSQTGELFGEHAALAGNNNCRF